MTTFPQWRKGKGEPNDGLSSNHEHRHTSYANIASAAGLFTAPGFGVYKVTKHAVVALSEMLYYELAEERAQVKVSVVCPGFVNTPFGHLLVGQYTHLNCPDFWDFLPTNARLNL